MGELFRRGRRCPIRCHGGSGAGAGDGDGAPEGGGSAEAGLLRQREERAAEEDLKLEPRRRPSSGVPPLVRRPARCPRRGVRPVDRCFRFHLGLN